VLTGTLTYPPAGPLTTVAPSGGSGFQITLDDSLTPGRLMRFEVDYTSSAAFGRDTLTIPAGTPTVLFADGASSGTTSWNITPAGSWSVVSTDPGQPNRYFGEWGLGSYTPGANDRMILKSRLDLSKGVHAYAFYSAKWEFEQDYDAGMIEASLDSTTWTPLAATGSTPGTGSGTPQPLGKPLYNGSRRVWKSDIADLSPLAGPTRTRVNLRFRGLSDSGGQFDGLAFDSLRIVIYDPAAQPVPVAVANGPLPATLALASPLPNPARDRARFDFALPRAGLARLEILDVQGRRVRTLVDGPLAAGRYVHGWDLRDASGNGVAPGVYLARLTSGGAAQVRRLVVLD